MSRRAAAGAFVPGATDRYVLAFRMLASARWRMWLSRYLLVWLAVMAAAHVGIVTAGRCRSSLLQADHAHNICIAVSELACILLRLLGGAGPGNSSAVISSR